MRGAAIAALLTVLVSSTHANMGTAIVVAATGHFLVCNPIIAVLEAALLTRWAKIPFTRGLPLMIAANYLSFFVGLLLGERISLTLGGVSQMLLGDDSMGVFPCRAVSLLPGDYAVMELGGRIWVLHLPTRRIGLLAKGYMPIAVITEQAGQG